MITLGKHVLEENYNINYIYNTKCYKCLRCGEVIYKNSVFWIFKDKGISYTMNSCITDNEYTIKKLLE